MKRLVPFVLVACMAVFAFAGEAETPPPSVWVRCDSAELGGGVARELTGRGIEVREGEGALYVVDVKALPSALTRVRSSAGDSPASENVVVRRAAVKIAEAGEGGRVVMGDTVAAPGDGLAAAVAQRVAEEVGR